MFMTKAKHEAVKRENERLLRENHALTMQRDDIERRLIKRERAHRADIVDYNRLVEKANRLVRRVRELEAGGTTQFSPDEIRTLRRLCHPDRHGNSTASNNITQKLNRILD